MTTFRLAGVDVPRIGLGSNRLTTAPEHVAFVREAVAVGVRHIDTAHLYTGGESERAIGEALGGAAEDVLVATKGGYDGAGQGRPDVLGAQIEQSLRSLRVEAIDLYYLHRVDPETPLEESLGAIQRVCPCCWRQKWAICRDLLTASQRGTEGGCWRIPGDSRWIQALLAMSA
jgi:aryl-alcohol dehydrogenase-like predicted oxidoreductase